YSTVALIERGASSVTIGRPIDNTVVYILDRYQQPVPIGVSGELYIGGSGLARGYLNQPELTQAKFIPNPFNPDSKSRLYRTGDLVRYLPDGTMEFLGRIDHQVKIRGFRIELGEIEAILQQYSNQHSDPDEPAIENVLVMARTDETGNTSLVAYLTPDLSDRQLTEIRHYLKAKLPGYMVPSAIVSLNHFPQTPNGKVDRQALPAPSFFSSALSAATPGNAIEESIAAVWRQMLRCSEVSIHDNFFDVGGHSLLVVQIHHQLSSAYPFLTIVDLFTYPTIHSLANYVLHQTGSSQIESEIQEAATFTRSPEPTSQARGARRRTAQAMRQRRGQSL
ncbi:MAG: non-ribosomal peptide synthetase, partial [Leptolyngbyaceae cyanobacterium]